MGTTTVIEFTLRGDFAFFRKPDTNEGLSFGYTMLHRPGLLGILGGILGLGGFRRRGEEPEYLAKLRSLHLGIAPAPAPEKTGPINPAGWAKTDIEYNNGVGYASQEQGGNWILHEQHTVAPAFTCFVAVDESDALQAELAERLLTARAVFPPYFGKNECAAYWRAGESARHAAEPFTPSEDYRVTTLLRRPAAGFPEIVPFDLFDLDAPPISATFFFREELPTGYRRDLWQYELAEHVYTPFAFQTGQPVENLYRLYDGRTVQLN